MSIKNVPQLSNVRYNKLPPYMYIKPVLGLDNLFRWKAIYVETLITVKILIMSLMQLAYSCMGMITCRYSPKVL